jgi:hypothetical protein
MRTRTLLLLAVGCGLAILLAGGVFFLQIARTDKPTTSLPIGATAQAGDLEVTVVGATESGGRMSVDVELAGVDADVRDDFTLLAGTALKPVGGEPGECARATVAPQQCTLVFDTSDVVADVRVLLLRRGEDQHRWTLTGS